MNIYLMVSPIQIVAFVIILAALVITSLVIASKNETSFNFLIWALIIIFIPFVEGISYLIKFYTTQNRRANKLIN